MSLNPPNKGHWFSRTVTIIGLVFLLSVFVLAQTTVGTGSIVGTVTDAQDAVVSGAKVVVANTQTGSTLNLTTNAAGSFTSGALPPGQYKIQITAKGFSTVSLAVTVQVGNTASGNAKLQVGQESQVVEVAADTVAVNTEQSEVQGVLTSDQIENLPVNGRNFLDMAQLEPGVQIQDGQNFDPTKGGYSSISFGGRFGRTARINVDGVDISDETVGTTTQDVPASAIDQFQLSQSSLDLSNDLTSSGAVNVTTKSGTNTYHGEAFGLFRDRSVGGAQPPGGSLPFQRSQYGGNVGGAIIKSKLFFFIDGERIKQDSLAPVQFAAPFTSLNGGFGVPFRDNELMGKVDYTFHNGARLFYRYNYFSNSLPTDFGLGYSVFVNKDIARTHVVGYDFNTGSFTHTIRFSYLKFQNQIADATLGSNLPLANTGVTLDAVGTGLWTGPSPDAPQSTPQQNTQVKYDGSKAVHSHIFRYGASFNHIQGGGFASFFGITPRISWTNNAFAINFANDSCDPAGIGTVTFPAAGTPCFPGGASNPLNYPTQNMRFGNGLGFNTEKPALGFPAGGLGPDNRLGLYVGDSWKVFPTLTLALGLRYDRDTGRTDSDLPADASINAQFPGFGNPVKQPNMNLAPQFGFAWDPSKSGKTVIRGGVGLYFENIIYNNELFDRPLRLQNGAFNQTPSVCKSGVPQPQPIKGGTFTPVCTNPALISAGIPKGYIPAGNAITTVVNQWHTYEAGNPVDLSAPNPNYIGNFLAGGEGVPLGVFAPNYQSPRSVQMNIGIQHELRHGMVVNADFLRNVETKSLLGIDVNHDGDVKNFNLAAAQQAISDTNASFGCGPTDVQCAINAGASMTDYAQNGLGSAADFGAGCNVAIGRPCAFGGKNINQAASLFLEPVGRSVYNALQVKLVQNVTSPIRGVKALNFQFAYSLSSFKNSGGVAAGGTSVDNDQDFVLQAADNNNPNRYFGQSLLDRTHQFSFGGYADLPFKFRLGLIGHFYSPLSTSLIVANSGLGEGEIFRTDFTGDGTVQDPMPGTHLGQFDRGTNASNINALINNYNSTIAGQATPAGQVLIKSSLMSLAQLQALNGVAQPLGNAPTDQANFTWLRSFDLNLGWRFTVRERFTIEPSVAVFNVFNMGNFNIPPFTLSDILTGEPGSINGTSLGHGDNETFRVGNGTGVYALGAARQVEWGMKVTF